MSVNFEGIDLNSDVVSIASNKLDETELENFTAGDEGKMGEASVNESKVFDGRKSGNAENDGGVSSGLVIKEGFYVLDVEKNGESEGKGYEKGDKVGKSCRDSCDHVGYGKQGQDDNVGWGVDIGEENQDEGTVGGDKIEGLGFCEVVEKLGRHVEDEKGTNLFIDLNGCSDLTGKENVIVNKTYESAEGVVKGNLDRGVINAQENGGEERLNNDGDEISGFPVPTEGLALLVEHKDGTYPVLDLNAPQFDGLDGKENVYTNEQATLSNNVIVRNVCEPGCRTTVNDFDTKINHDDREKLNSYGANEGYQHQINVTDPNGINLFVDFTRYGDLSAEQSARVNEQVTGGANAKREEEGFNTTDTNETVEFRTKEAVQHHVQNQNAISLVADLTRHDPLSTNEDLANEQLRGEFSEGVDSEVVKEVALVQDCVNEVWGTGTKNGVSLENESEVNLVVDLSRYGPLPKAVISDQVAGGLLENLHGEGPNNDVLIPKVRGKECAAEIEGEFYVSDIVWGKVRSHPWWPGLIFDPSTGSEKAMKYFKRGSYLIAYFGDQTFAWNEASRIKPFRTHFSQMEKQSNLEAFSHAVGCALDEVSRRVEFGLSCRCLPEQVLARIKSQVVVNAGIRGESSRREGGDAFSSVASFIPGNLVEYLKSLAASSYFGTDRLELVKAKAQLLAFSRWKGRYKLPAFEVFEGLQEKEKDSDEAVEGPNRDKVLAQKEKTMSDLMLGGSSRLDGYPKKSVQPGRKVTSLSSGKKRKADDCLYHDSADRSRKFPKLRKNSDRILSSPQRFVRIGEQVQRANIASSGTSRKRKVIPAESPPPEEMLSRLYLAAKDPMNGYYILSSIFSSLSKFRNSVCLQNTNHQGPKKSTGYDKGKEAETTEVFGFEGMEDTYWTDRIIENYPREQVLFEPGNKPDKNGSATGQAVVTVSRGKEEKDEVTRGSESENPPDTANDKSDEYAPTALILNFTDLESIPSIKNLNSIFCQYGPLNESDTEVLTKSKRAKVVFKRRPDAETAFSSAGKYSIFGPSLVSYRLKYSPRPRKGGGASGCKRKTAAQNNVV